MQIRTSCKCILQDGNIKGFILSCFRQIPQSKTKRHHNLSTLIRFWSKHWQWLSLINQLTNEILRKLITGSAVWYRSVFKSFTGGCRCLVILIDLLVFGKPTSGLSLRYPKGCDAGIMEPRPNTCSTSSSFSIENILSDKREEEPTNFQCEPQAHPNEYVRPNFQVMPPFVYGTFNTWPHRQPHGCSPFDRSRKTTGKWYGNNSPSTYVIK